MANTRSKASESAVNRVKEQRKKARDLLQKEIADKKKRRAKGDKLEKLEKEPEEVDRMDTEDDPQPNANGGASTSNNAPAPNPSTLIPQDPKTTAGGSGSPSLASDCDETGELCVVLTTLSIHEGTPVAYRHLRGGDIGLIMRLGPIEACTYELQKVGKGYQVEGLMAKEELKKGSCTFKFVHGVLIYNGNLIDVKVRMLRPKEGSDGEIQSTVHWIIRTNLNDFLPKEVGLGYIKDVGNKQEQAYAKIDPDHEIRPFPQMRTRKSGDKDGHEQRT